MFNTLHSNTRFKFRALFILAFGCLLLTLQGCESETSTQSHNQAQTTEPAVDPDSEGFISTESLYRLFKAGNVPPIFDVRSVEAYQKSHIETSTSLPYGKFTEQDVAKSTGGDLSRLLVTYCGCPRHLSGLVAQQLRDMGYTDVNVLYEGYWYWVDSGYPVVENQKTARTRLHFSGRLLSENAAVHDRQIFILNTRNGQLEATQTNDKGYFQTGFEILEYQPTDQFEFYIDSLNGPVVTTIHAKAGTDLQIILPSEPALTAVLH